MFPSFDDLRTLPEFLRSEYVAAGDWMQEHLDKMYSYTKYKKISELTDALETLRQGRLRLARLINKLLVTDESFVVKVSPAFPTLQDYVEFRKARDQALWENMQIVSSIDGVCAELERRLESLESN